MNDTTLSAHEFPQAIVDHQSSGALELTWQDGSTSLLPHALLRSACRCGGCEQQYRQSGVRAAAPPDIRLADIQPVGDKGLNLVFSDGHGRGIYPWAYLHELSLSTAS
ncbi:MAG TPA: DUF971 domain-containing protein [Rhizobacter sp.]|nr:DUF971 domain-containing protein [Rhizobacter sp.]